MTLKTPLFLSFSVTCALGGSAQVAPLISPSMPLHIQQAIAQGELAPLERHFNELKQDILATDTEGYSVLMVAIAHGQPSIIMPLIRIAHTRKQFCKLYDISTPAGVTCSSLLQQRIAKKDHLTGAFEIIHKRLPNLYAKIQHPQPALSLENL